MNSTLPRKPEVDSATKFLQRLRGARRKTWEAAEFAKLEAKGNRPKDDRWKERFVEPSPADTADLPDLPADWCWATIEELCPLDGPAVYGIIQPGDHVDGGVPYIRPLDISDEGTVELSQLKRTTRRIADDYERSKLRNGDVVLSIVGTIGKVLQVTRELEGANITQSSIRIRPPDGMPPRYLKLMLQSPVMRSQYDRFRFGNAVQRLNVEHVRRLAVPVAPLEGQHRIVERLDELLAQSRAAREHLEAVPALVETYRQSVLAAALRGALTAGWRKKNQDVEPASKLLERIRIERRKNWEEGELAKMKAKGVKPKDDRWKAKYVEPEPVDPSGLPELPESWCWASLDQLLHSLRNGIGVKPDEEEGLPILRISAVRPMALDLEDVRFLSPSGEFDAYALREGDLLFTRYNGNADLVGSCAVVNRISRTVVYPDKLIRARVVAPHVLPQYLAMAASTGATRAFIATKSKSAAGQVGVSGADLKRAPVPLAPLEEQRALVACIELLEGGTNVLEAGDVACSRLAELERSLLAKAFSGHLVR